MRQGVHTHLGKTIEKTMEISGTFNEAFQILNNTQYYFIDLRPLHISTTNSPETKPFSIIFYDVFIIFPIFPLTFQAGPRHGCGESIRCITSTTWTPVLSSPQGAALYFPADSSVFFDVF